MGRSLFALLVAALFGCQFDGSGAPGGDAGNAIIDGGDAAGAEDGGRCGWPYAPVLFDPCDLEQVGPPLHLDDPGKYLYDSDLGQLTTPSGSRAVVNPIIDGTRVVVTESFLLGEGSHLRVEGSLPLAIASFGSLELHGDLDASSRAPDPMGAGDLDGVQGAGADPDDCPERTDAAIAGTNYEQGGGGGGGGGFGGGGAVGGDGRQQDTGSGEGDGGGGGPVRAGPPSRVRGGCPGGNGGEGNGTDLFGVGGSGGGGVHLAAAGEVLVSGSVNAGGAGGGGSRGARSGGGGGGSGGLIGLEGSAVVVEPGATLAANGGGGGGGANSCCGESGQDGLPELAPAEGGAGEGNSGGNGGAGATGNAAPSPGSDGDRGGGGGGGGVGFILLHSDDLTTDGAVFTPGPTTIGLGPGD